MIFKELINIVDYDSIRKVFDNRYNHKFSAYKAYKGVLKKLKMQLEGWTDT